MRMEQYLTHINYAIWEVIVNGDAPAADASASTGAKAPIEVSWNQGCKINQGQVWRQQKSKKMQKTILKQQYENFTASRSEGLDKTYDRFQKLISQLEIHDGLSMDDLYNNLKVYEVEIKSQSSSSSN
ncbi:hypothetical protein Tco_0253950, partial [Tanacetum coccineum]